MKTLLIEQSHRVTLKLTEARVSLLRQLSPSEVKLSISFLATHYCKQVDGVEVATPFIEPIVYDTIEQIVPFDLWIGIVKAAEAPEILPTINEALAPFNALFVNSMEGLELQIESVTMG